uniref:Probable ATP-dependent RNA helicase DDX52 n=1 Tax=Trichuris muris TaxID=70415 RepID=A0A5S6QRC2_TRIMR
MTTTADDLPYDLILQFCLFNGLICSIGDSLHEMNCQERLYRMLSFGASRKGRLQNTECTTEPCPSLRLEENGSSSGQALDDEEKLEHNADLLEDQGLKLFHESPGVSLPNDTKRQSKCNAENRLTPSSLEKRKSTKNQQRLPSELALNVRKLGFSTPTKIQMQAIPVMLEDRELMANAPTGSGKTLAFVIPALNEILKSPRSEDSTCQVLVVEPTLELARQVYFDFLRVIGDLPITICLTSKHTNNTVGTRYDIIVSTPNRLIYSVEADPPLYDLRKVKWLIIDECDRLFEAGERGFREQLSKIYQACNNSQTRRALFSATFSYHLEQWCKINLNSLVLVCVGARNSAVSSVKQKLIFVGSEHGKLVAVERMFVEGFQPPMLIFVQSKERAEQLYNELICMNRSAELVHANRTAQQRETAMKRFRTGEVPIMVCSELVGRGIDFKAVNTVVNYDFPTSSVSYIHCIGRTGRAGRSGTAITFFTESDTPLLRNIGNIIKAAGCPVPDYVLQLPKASKNVKQWLASHAPRREAISNLPVKMARKRRRVHAKPVNNAQTDGDSAIAHTRENVSVKTQNSAGKVCTKPKRKKKRKDDSKIDMPMMQAVVNTRASDKDAPDCNRKGQKVRRKKVTFAQL